MADTLDMPDPALLLDRVLALRDDVERQVRTAFPSWPLADADAEVRASAANLVRYLALRRHDLAGLQRDLSLLGLSSLGRAEARVGPQLDAVAWALAGLAGRPDGPLPPTTEDLGEGERILIRRTHEVFGRPPTDRRVRVLATLPSSAADDPDVTRRLAAAGADAVRINTAHDDPDRWAAMARYVRAAAEELGTRVAIEVDLAGPKMRLAAGVPDARQYPGDTFWLVPAGARPCASGQDGAPLVEVTLPAILEQVAVGSQVWFDDGKIGGHVVEASMAVEREAPPDASPVHSVGTALRVVVERAARRGQRLRLEKGVNFPETEIDLPVPTAEDLAALPHALAIADAIGFSFVQRPAEVDALHDLIADLSTKPPPALVLKVETRLAVRNLPSLIVHALRRGPTAVMIARGDLGVELGFERLAEVQEELLWLCEAAHVPVIWATQVLEAMAKRGVPTRAEVTDAAMGERAECVMLNKGPYAEEAVRSLADVLRRMHRHQTKKAPRLGALRAWASEG